MHDDAPIFEVTSVAASAAARRLTTAAKVTAALKLPDGTDTALIESIIDGISGECARNCRLARNAAFIPTFGQEILKATYLVARCNRGTQLILRWRAPISAIGTITEDGNTLVSTDYVHRGAGVLERLSADTPVCWSNRKIVVAYTAGWSLPDNVPPEIEARVIEQAKMAYSSTDRDPALRSENMPDVWAGTYAVAGGDSIGTSGLLLSLEQALEPFRDQAII